jgi:hypothetical protein
MTDEASSPPPLLASIPDKASPPLLDSIAEDDLRIELKSLKKYTADLELEVGELEERVSDYVDQTDQQIREIWSEKASNAALRLKLGIYNEEMLIATSSNFESSLNLVTKVMESQNEIGAIKRAWEDDTKTRQSLNANLASQLSLQCEKSASLESDILQLRTSLSAASLNSQEHDLAIESYILQLQTSLAAASWKSEEHDSSIEERDIMIKDSQIIILELHEKIQNLSSVNTSLSNEIAAAVIKSDENSQVVIPELHEKIQNLSSVNILLSNEIAAAVIKSEEKELILQTSFAEKAKTEEDLNLEIICHGETKMQLKDVRDLERSLAQQNVMILGLGSANRTLIDKVAKLKSKMVEKESLLQDSEKRCLVNDRFISFLEVCSNIIIKRVARKVVSKS